MYVCKQEPYLGSRGGVDANGGEARLKAAAPGGELCFLDLGFRVRAQCLGFRVQGLGFRV